MKLISWNVAGLRACLNKGFTEFFNNVNADVFCIQEARVEKDQYNFHPEGYFEYLYSAKKRGYSGTLVYSKIEPLNVTYGIGDDRFDNEGRTITLEYDTFFLVNNYVPNVKRTLERMGERMEWEDLMRAYLHDLSKKKTVIVCGDMNVAHEEIDIKNVKSNIGMRVLLTKKEKNLQNSWVVDLLTHLDILIQHSKVLTHGGAICIMRAKKISVGE